MISWKLIVFLFVVQLASSGTIVKVTNTGGSTGRLSDLVVYGAGGQMKTILAPGNPADDVTLSGFDTRLFDAGFEVTSYVVSEASFVNPASERESILINVKQLRSQPISFVQTPTGQNLVDQIDFDSGLLSIPVGSVSVVNGAITGMPGWLVGTDVDFTTGSLTGLYTGEAVFSDGALSVATIPEPVTARSYAIALLLLIGMAQWRMKSRAGLSGDVTQRIKTLFAAATRGTRGHAPKLSPSLLARYSFAGRRFPPGPPPS